MGLVSLSLPSDGTTADVSDYNTPITTLKDEFNGNIDNNNIKSGAAIDGSKLADASITSGKVAGISKATLTTDVNVYKFRVYRLAAATVSNGSYGKVQFETESYDSNSNYDNATNYRYTAPVAGFYQFNWRVSHANSGSNRMTTALYKNGSIIARGGDVTSPFGGSSGSDLVSLAANDYVEIFALTGAAAIAFDVGADVTYFSGFLVSRT